MHSLGQRFATAFCLAGLFTATGAAEGYAVRVTASVQSSPAQITLQWPADPSALSYSVARKLPGAGSWGPATPLPGNAVAYTDTQVSTGTVYEYQVIKQAAGNVTGYGYLTSAIDAPLVDQRGRVILVVDNSHAAALEGELRTLVRDLAGDGWTVTRLDVSPGDAPTGVRERIRSAYQADRANTRAVFLFGHVPVVKSGNLNVDGHEARPLPADVFYGDMDGTWTDANGDGVYDANTLPSDVELAVGRVDFADLPAGGAPEAVLLQQYLFKNHDFRHGIRRPAERALIGDRFGGRNGEAFAASAYRAFPALVGNGNLVEADVRDDAPVSARWITRLTTADYLWVYGGGGGGASAIAALGTHGPFGDVWSSDLVQQRARGTFYLLFGSWFVDWSQRDNIMRAALAVPDHGLAAAWSGRPHLFFHPVALGETLGHAMRLSQNNATLYANQVNAHTRGIHLALLGDPTLRQRAVAPPADVRASAATSGVTLTWSASAEAMGYHVYRGTDVAGPFTRVSSELVTATGYTDTSAPAGSLLYQVRAVKLETTPAGRYFNASQGVFAEVNSISAPAPAPAPSPTPAPAPAPAPTPTPTPAAAGSSGGSGGAPGWGTTLALGLLLLWRRHRVASAGRARAAGEARKT